MRHASALSAGRRIGIAAHLDLHRGALRRRSMLLLAAIIAATSPWNGLLHAHLISARVAARLEAADRPAPNACASS